MKNKKLNKLNKFMIAYLFASLNTNAIPYNILPTAEQSAQIADSLGKAAKGAVTTLEGLGKETAAALEQARLNINEILGGVESWSQQTMVDAGKNFEKIFETVGYHLSVTSLEAARILEKVFNIMKEGVEDNNTFVKTFVKLIKNREGEIGDWLFWSDVLEKMNSEVLTNINGFLFLKDGSLVKDLKDLGIGIKGELQKAIADLYSNFLNNKRMNNYADLRKLNFISFDAQDVPRLNKANNASSDVLKAEASSFGVVNGEVVEILNGTSVKIVNGVPVTTQGGKHVPVKLDTADKLTGEKNKALMQNFNFDRNSLSRVLQYQGWQAHTFESCTDAVKNLQTILNDTSFVIDQAERKKAEEIIAATNKRLAGYDEYREKNLIKVEPKASSNKTAKK